MELKNAEMGNAIIVGPDVLVHDPNSIEYLRKGSNTLIIPWIVLQDLESLESRSDIGIDASDAATTIEDLRMKDDASLVIYRIPTSKYFKENLSKNNSKHHLLATALAIKDQDAKKYKKIKLVSRTKIVRIQARQLGIETENYLRDRLDEPLDTTLKTINVEKAEINKDRLIFDFNKDDHKDVVENEGVLCLSNFRQQQPHANHDWGEAFTAIRKGNIFEIIPTDISAMGISSFTLNGDGPNWHQMIAFRQLLDPEIDLCFLGGGAGTGKTLLALASAITRRRDYHQIVISRPMYSLEDEDKMGFLPGDVDEKIRPWFVPILDNLRFMQNVENSDNSKVIEDLREKGKMIFAPLDYIRGTTFHKKLVIIDESQNLTPHQIKTIITRAGSHTKMIFTGDLGQIDRKKKLDARSSGLAYAMSRMKGRDLVSSIVFKNVVRSRLACLAEELL